MANLEKGGIHIAVPYSLHIARVERKHVSSALLTNSKRFWIQTTLLLDPELKVRKGEKEIKHENGNPL